MRVEISGIHVYPVKSARGISVGEANIDERGLEGDRRWMVVDESGDFLTQREVPRMCLVTTEIAGESLVLGAPGLAPLRLPRALESIARATRSVRVWDDTCDAISGGAEASEWMTSALGTRCDLVYMPDTTRRLVSSKYTAGADATVSFADGFPFLIVSEASLAELNGRLPASLPMDRFRPNLVVSGCEAFAEDGWSTFTAGSVTFRVAKPCSRCSITTIDQIAAEAAPEPLRTLARYRTIDGRVMFGQNLIHTGRGTIRVGDTISLQPGNP